MAMRPGGSDLAHDIVEALVAGIEVRGSFLVLLSFPFASAVSMHIPAVPAAPSGFVPMPSVVPI